MSGLEYIDCDLCETDDSRPLFMKKYLKTNEDLRIVECKKCGLIYMNPRPKQDSVEGIYLDNYSLGYIAKEKKKKRRAKKIINKITKFKKGGRFLDIGCSAGFILEAAGNKGFQAYGVEICPDALRYAREKLGLRVIDGYLEGAHFQDKFFDVITIYSVLEHVLHPTKFLQEVARILKDDGLIEIWTPNIGHRWAKRLKGNWPAIIPGHLWYFTLDTIQKILNKAGLKIYKKQFTFKDGLQLYVKKSP